MSDDAIATLVHQFSRLPGIGEKTATRLAYFVLTAAPELASDLAKALLDARTGVTFCGGCQDIALSDPCPRCTDPRRADDCIVVVERPQDLRSIEASGAWRGRYHVLHGALSPLDGIGPERLRIRPLLAHLESGAIREVVIATNATAEGDATALYLARLLEPLVDKISRIATGVALGSELEYVDPGSMTRALQNRRSFASSKSDPTE